MPKELLQELKKAGFPEIYIGRDITLDVPYVPTLSELIEVCGGDICLYRNHSDEWRAANQNPEMEIWESMSHLVRSGSTPEEAVARLWLALKT